MFITAFLAWITAQYMVEAVSIANTLNPHRRRNSIFNEECYKTPQARRKRNDKDAEIKDSEFYIRQKLELGLIADRVSAPWMKYAILVLLVIYMYGAMALKYVSGAESLY